MLFSPLLYLLLRWYFCSVGYNTLLAVDLLNISVAKRSLQPVIGALMGLTPGCGGAIVMMPMYARGYVTYGTVLATLIATLGDSAFVLIGAAINDSNFVAPLIAVHAISFVAGVTWGYLVDMTGTTPRQPLGRFGPTIGQESPEPETVSDSPLDDLSREEPGGIGYKILHQGYVVWWSITVLGLIFAILLLVWSGQDPDYSLELSYNPATIDGLITWIGLDWNNPFCDTVFGTKELDWRRY